MFREKIAKHETLKKALRSRCLYYIRWHRQIRHATQRPAETVALSLPWTWAKHALNGTLMIFPRHQQHQPSATSRVIVNHTRISIHTIGHHDRLQQCVHMKSWVLNLCLIGAWHFLHWSRVIICSDRLSCSWVKGSLLIPSCRSEQGKNWWWLARRTNSSAESLVHDWKRSQITMITPITNWSLSCHLSRA